MNTLKGLLWKAPASFSFIYFFYIHLTWYLLVMQISFLLRNILQNIYIKLFKVPSEHEKIKVNVIKLEKFCADRKRKIIICTIKPK